MFTTVGEKLHVIICGGLISPWLGSDVAVGGGGVAVAVAVGVGVFVGKMRNTSGKCTERVAGGTV